MKKKHTWGSRHVSSPSHCSSRALSSSHCPSVEVRGCGGGRGDMYGDVKIPGPKRRCNCCLGPIVSLWHWIRNVIPRRIIKYQLKEGNNNKKTHLGPKRRISRRLGPLSLLPALNHTVPLEYSKFLCKSLSTKKKHEENKKSSPKAQTTRLASFGPVIVVVSVYKGIRVFLYIKCTY